VPGATGDLNLTPFLYADHYQACVGLVILPVSPVKPATRRHDLDPVSVAGAISLSA